MLAGSLALGVGLLRSGLAATAVVATCALLSALVCFVLERTFPETPRWKLDPGEARADLLHALLSNPIPTLIYRSLFYALAGRRLRRAHGADRLEPVARGWPLLAQLGLALLVAEAAAYAIHRHLHRSALWPLHAVHHCSPRMYFLLAVRKHPLQAFITYGGRLSVLWLLGVPPTSSRSTWCSPPPALHVRHANIACGRDHSASSSPAGASRLHHSKRSPELDANLGDVLNAAEQPAQPRSLQQINGVARWIACRCASAWRSIRSASRRRAGRAMPS